MKKYIRFIIALVTISLGVFSCSSDVLSENKGGTSTVGKSGKVSFKLKPSGTFDVAVRSSENVSTDNFKITIYNSNNDVVQSWDKFQDMPEIIALNAGDYTVEASSGLLKAAEFNSPYYYGKKDFTVVFEEMNSVELTCILSNMKVTVEYNDFFLSNFESFEVKVQIKDNSVIPQGQTGVLKFDETVTSAGYYMVTPLMILVEGTKIGGQPFTHIEEITKVNLRDWHRIKLSVNPIGSGGFEILVNTETTNIDHEITIPTDDEDLGLGGDTTEPDPNPGDGDGEVDPPAPQDVLPTVVGIGFNIEEQVTILNSDISYNPDLGADVSTKPVKVAITAEEGGIQSLVVKISMSDAGLQEIVNGMFGGDSFDLANLSDALTGTITSLGLIQSGQSVKNEKIFQFDLTTFMSLLESGVSNFTLTVVDSKNNSINKVLSVNRVKEN